MAIKKIPCGGWSYDDSEIVFEDGVIHPIEKSELPEVTSADNGKVLGVVDGEWDKTEAGGGGSDNFLITLTYDSTTDAWTADNDKTVNNYLDMLINGTKLTLKAVVMQDDVEMIYLVTSNASYLISGSVTEIYFTTGTDMSAAYTGTSWILES